MKDGYTPSKPRIVRSIAFIGGKLMVLDRNGFPHEPNALAERLDALAPFLPADHAEELHDAADVMRALRAEVGRTTAALLTTTETLRTFLAMTTLIDKGLVDKEPIVAMTKKLLDDGPAEPVSDKEA